MINNKFSPWIMLSLLLAIGVGVHFFRKSELRESKVIKSIVTKVNGPTSKTGGGVTLRYSVNREIYTSHLITDSYKKHQIGDIYYIRYAISSPKIIEESNKEEYLMDNREDM